jgi:hypothetical protein
LDEDAVDAEADEDAGDGGRPEGDAASVAGPAEPEEACYSVKISFGELDWGRGVIEGLGTYQLRK